MSSGNPETRVRIMEATRLLLEDGGGEPVRMKDIAAAAGVSRQAIYLHFGSRVGLMLATVQHVDEGAGFRELAQHVHAETDSLNALDVFVDFWASYVPMRYPLAKELLAQRETDDAAAAAWDDRMDSLRNGPCRFLVRRLQEDERLAPDLDAETAVDTLWMLVSISTWENLVVERGWSQEQYATQLKRMLRRVLTCAP